MLRESGDAVMVKEEKNMRVVKEYKVESKEVVFEPGNATRYHLVLTRLNTHTLAVTDLNEKKVIILDPEFPSIGSYRDTIYKYGYSSSDAFAMAVFIAGQFETNEWRITE